MNKLGNATVNYYSSFNSALKGIFKDDVRVNSFQRIFGGDINIALKIKLNNGQELFMKANSLANKEFFFAEINGLEAIKSTGTIKTPEVYCCGQDEGKDNPLRNSCSFLLMKYIPSNPKVKGYWENLGIQLAKMHLSETKTFVPEGKFGFFENNFIGASSQINSSCDSWIQFFKEKRLEVQIQRAEKYFSSQQLKQAIQFLDKLDSLITEPEKPALLHGDLWSGNVHTDETGNALLIDPAAYCGHWEAEISMTKLFGSFPKEFYYGYNQINPIPKDFYCRQEIYNLYHLLNHLNLFGQGYFSQVMGIIQSYV